MFRASTKAKQVLAQFIASSGPQDMNHDRAVTMMRCFTEVDYVYNQTLEKHHGVVASAFVYGATLPWHTHIYFLKPFFTSPPTSQTRTILHECSHLYANTKDHAYLHQYHYWVLHEEEQRTNADSFVEYIMNKATKAKHVEVSSYPWDRHYLRGRPLFGAPIHALGA